MDGQNFNNEQGSDQNNTNTQDDFQNDYNQNNGYQNANVNNVSADQASSDSRTLEIVGLVMGILGIVLGCCYGIGIIFAIVGLICSIIAMKRNKSGLAIAGLVCSIVGALLSVYMIISIISVFTDPEKYALYQELMRQMMNQQ